MRPKIIQKPYLKTMDYFWGDYTRLWNNFKEIYNKEENGEDKPSRYQLKAGHMQVYFRLVKEAQKKMRAENKAVEGSPKLCAIDPNKPYIVTRSKHVLAKINGVSPDTAKRHIKRLCIAGVISTDCAFFIKHYGRKKRRGEILINPDFLLIYDAFEPNYVPVSKFLKTEKCGFQPQKDANCPGVSSIGPLQDSVNNKISPVHNVEKGIDSVDKPNNTRALLKPDTKPSKSQVPANGQQKSQKSRKIKFFRTESTKKPETPEPETRGSAAPPPKIVDNFAEKRRSYAIELYMYLVKQLFPFHNIYKGEASLSISYIEKTYFKGVNDESKAQRLMAEYRWRIDAAVRYIEQHRIDFSNIYPRKYLDVSYTKGFAATKRWYDTHLQNKKRKAAMRAQKEHCKSVIYKAVQAYNEAPGLSTFKRQCDYIEQNAPGYLELFMKETNTLNIYS